MGSGGRRNGPAKLAGNPVLSEFLRRIMKQEGRRIDFCASEAKSRVARLPGLQGLDLMRGAVATAA